MNQYIYKKFIYELRKIECNTPCLIIIKEHPPRYLKQCVKMLLEVPFDSTAFNAYYGELKKIISSFMNFYITCIENANKEAEEYSRYLTFDKIMQLMEQTANNHDIAQEDFIKEFQPLESEEDQQKFETIISDYSLFKTELLKLGEDLASFKKKQDKIDAFAKEHFHTSVKKTSELCDFAHIFIAKWLFDRLHNIRVSIEEIARRMQRNQREFKENNDSQLNRLYHKMYDLNKERLRLSRQNRNANDIAEINKMIAGVSSKIKNVGKQEMCHQLHYENQYWSAKLEEFNKIAAIITKIKNALDKVTSEEKQFSEYSVLELPGPKVKFWENIGDNYLKSKLDLEEKYDKACRTLITFFCCRGSDRTLYTDNVGTYYIDEYGHQNYMTNYGAMFYHVDCDGNFVKNAETDKYYYDTHGRYTLQDEERIYQLAPCTSQYKFGENQLLYKINQDCGHSTKANDQCRHNIKDLTNMEMLPMTEEVNIIETMDTETVEYLWNTFGWILPEVLCEVGKTQSKNPIHHFAHVLLNKRYTTTKNDIESKKNEAEKYRKEVLNKRRKVVVAAVRAWKSKQMKHVKPEDIDTAAQDVAFSVHQSDRQFVTDVMRFCYDDLY